MKPAKILFPVVSLGLVILLAYQVIKKNDEDGIGLKENISVGDIPIEDIIEYDRKEAAAIRGLDLDGTIVADQQGDSISINNIFQGDVIVGRYSIASCNDCISHLIDVFLEHKRSYPNDQLVLLIADILVRDLHVLRNELGGTMNVYAVDQLPSDFDGAITPYVFRLTKTTRIIRPFIPRKEIPILTYEYLDVVTDD